MCAGSPEISAKWGPAASKSPGFSGERKEPPPFWSNETCQPFQLGSACSFPFSNIHKHNERQQRLNLKQMSCALDLEPVFPSRARHWLGHQVGSPPPPQFFGFSWMQKEVGAGGWVWDDTEEGAEGGRVAQMAETGAEGELSEASWEPGAQLRSPGV